MEMFPVIVCLVGMLLWVAVWRRRASGPPIVWTRRRVISISAGILGAVAVPVLVLLGRQML